MKPSAAVVSYFEKLSRVPGGKRLFSTVIARLIPYTGTIKAMVKELTPGRTVVEMSDRRSVRNHLRSIHALALANLGELSASLAMTSRQPEDARWIVTGIKVDYLKKARGTVTATADAPEIDWSTPAAHHITSVIRDKAGDVVTRVDVTLKVGRAGD